MEDWEKDDFDCTAQITDKLVTLGLDDALKNDSRKGAELTEKEKLALQMKSDEDIGLELLGEKRPEEAQKSWNEMRKINDFIQYADELGEHIAAQHKHPQYLLVVNSIVKLTCKPMTKIQLRTVLETVQGYLTTLEKKEEEQKKKENEAKEQVKAKKQNKKKLMEDVVEDEYDDFADKYF